MPIGYTERPTGPLDWCYRELATRMSRFSRGADLVPPAAQLAGFRAAQCLAYETVTTVAGRLEPGITEVQAAELLQDYLTSRGCERFLHRPFAWFGNHTRFDEYRSYDDYHPGSRALEPDATVILDVSPIVDGFIGDVGYTFSLKNTPALEEAQRFLLELRAEIPRLFMSEMKPADIWREVDQVIRDAGFDNIHAKYPFCTLGHRVFVVKPRSGRDRRLGFHYMSWFSVIANLQLIRHGPAVSINPENMGSRLGIWAIEPHIGWAGAGAKFEEILVVELDRAYWLDDNVPHVIEGRVKQ